MMCFVRETEENLKVMVSHFVEVCKRKGLKVKSNKSKMMVLGERMDRYVRSL